MSQSNAAAVIVDTNVWSILYGPRRVADEERNPLRAALQGRAIVIAVQVRAEVLAGLEHVNYSPQKRQRTIDRLQQTPVIPVDESVVWAFARLYAAARRIGHAIAQRPHVGDRWIAASAIAIGAPLLSLDRIFRNAPALTLLEENGRNDV